VAEPIVKTLKAEGWDEIRPEMLKTLNGGVLWLTRVCHVACWCSGRASKGTKTGVITQYKRWETEENALINYPGISLLCLNAKMYAKCFEKTDAAK